MYLIKHNCVWLMQLLLVICIQDCLIDGGTRYVSNKGDDKSTCGNYKIPCKTLHYAIKISSAGDDIYVKAKYSNEEFNICKNGDTISLDKSISIRGFDNVPMLYCNSSTFAFNATSGLTNNVNVLFEDVSFTNFPSNSKHIKKCNSPLYGFLHVQNANIKLSNCVFKNVCSIIFVDYNKDIMYSISVVSTEMFHVYYVIYSENIKKGNISVSSTKIIGNTLTLSDGPSHAFSLKSNDTIIVTIKDCSIQNTNEGIAVTVRNGKYVIAVESTVIFENEGQGILFTLSDKVDYNNSSISITQVEFIKNKGIFAPVLHLVGKGYHHFKVKVDVTECTFYQNEADTFFGAIYAEGVHLTISNSFFANNIAGGLHISIQGFGGAIYVESETIVEVSNTTFANNTCSGFGGTIFSRGTFSCANCSFTGASNILVRPLLGDILYATAGLTLINTTWTSTAMYEIPKDLIWHPGSPTVEDWGIKVGGYFEATCPVGHNITYSGIARQENKLTERMSMSCKPCRRNEYSLRSGTLYVQQGNGKSKSTETKANCHHCKYGGICSKGSIRPQANYYGFRTNSKQDEVHFISCPVGYCCQSDSCQKYDSCQKHRIGLLCGKCKNGTSENLINSDCIDPNECKDHWFWSLYLPCGVMYILCFMYLDRISTFIKQQLIWWEKQIHHRNDLEDCELLDAQPANRNNTQDTPRDGNNAENATINNDYNTGSLNSEDVLKPDDIQLQTSPADAERRDIFQKPGKKERGPDLFADFLTISFYFFQMFLLIRMRESIVLDYIMSYLRSIYSSIFTLSIEGNASFLLCPIPSLSAITKLVFINSFVCYVLTLLFTFHGVVYIIQYLLLQDLRRKAVLIVFSIRLKVATIQILLIGYSTLSTTAVTLISCVPLNKTWVLLIDGTITCYTWWQILIFLFVVAWVAPFPIVMVFSLVHLKKEIITYHQFILAWVFPLAYLIWVFLKFLFDKSNNNALRKELSLCLDDVSVETEEKLSVNEILFRLECPYKGDANYRRKLHTPESSSEHVGGETSGTLEPAFWQGALIFKRLILILVLTFVPAPVSRLYCALFLCILYLVHHLYYRPYCIQAANIFEAVSSTTLIVFCSMNLFFAYSYVSDLPPEAADEHLTIIFRWFEAMILVFLPTVMVFILACLILTRFFILIVQFISFSITNCFHCCRENIFKIV